MVAGIPTYPSDVFCSSVGMMTFPTEWKNGNVKTTNQVTKIHNMIQQSRKDMKRYMRWDMSSLPRGFQGRKLHVFWQ